jgi:hypothetical protein
MRKVVAVEVVEEQEAKDNAKPVSANAKHANAKPARIASLTGVKNYASFAY